MFICRSNRKPIKSSSRLQTTDTITNFDCLFRIRFILWASCSPVVAHNQSDRFTHIHKSIYGFQHGDTNAVKWAHHFLRWFQLRRKFIGFISIPPRLHLYVHDVIRNCKIYNNVVSGGTVAYCRFRFSYRVSVSPRSSSLSSQSCQSFSLLCSCHCQFNAISRFQSPH